MIDFANLKTSLPLLVDVVILVAAIELVALAGYRVFTGRGLPFREYAYSLCAGGCLMLAIRAVLEPNGAPLAVLLIAASGVAHLVDLWTVRGLGSKAR